MSNLLQNSDFSLPNLNANNLKYVQNFTTRELSQFIWTSTENVNGYEVLINGTGLAFIGSNFYYPDCSNVSSGNQFISIERSGGIKKTGINITQTGIYALSFQYAVNQGSNLNNLQISLNGTHVDTITTSPLNNDWNTVYANNFSISSTGSYILLLQGYDDGTDPFIGITNISMTYVLPLTSPNPSAPPVSPNIIINGTFAYPALSTNTFLLSTSLTTGRLQGWVPSSQIVLIKGTTVYGFPTTSNQYMALLGLAPNGAITQSLTGATPGLYTLTFNYASSSKYSSGALYINLISNNATTVISTVSYLNTTTTWTTFTCQVPITTGSLSISFNGGSVGSSGTNTNQAVAITNISLVLQTWTTDLSMNILTKSSIYGKFVVQPKYNTYDSSGNPSGSVVVDSGDSTMYGNLIVSGKSILVSGITTGDIIANGNTTTNNLQTNGNTNLNGNIIAHNDILCSGCNLYAQRIGVNTGTPAYEFDCNGNIHSSYNLYIDASCGIGTTTPSYTLDVSGIIHNNSSIFTNQIGVATTTPAYPLDVNGTIQSTNLYLPNTGKISAKATNGVFLDILFPCWNDNITYLSYATNGLSITDSTYNNVMFFNPSRQVGIGTTTPSYTLDVSGEIQTNSNLRMPNSGIIYGKNTTNSVIQVFSPCSSDNITYLSYGASGFNIRNSSFVNTMFFNASRQVGINTITTIYPLDVSGIIHSNNSIQSPKYDLSYTAIPTLTNISTGYTTTGTYASLPLTPVSSSFYAITFTSLPIGVYLIQGYAIGTFITTAITNIRLGLSTANNTLTANNYTQQILPILSTTQVQSIQYNYYLSNTATTTYYIVFATGASFGTSSITGFTSSFIRIA